MCVCVKYTFFLMDRCKPSLSVKLALPVLFCFVLFLVFSVLWKPIYSLRVEDNGK